MLRKITAASTFPVSVARAKDRLNIRHTDSDADITALIWAATEAVEKATGRILQPATYELALSECDLAGWGTYPLQIPVAPVRNILSVSYYDTAGTLIEITTPLWYWERSASGADLRFVDTFSFPTLWDREGSLVTVLFEAGYDAQGGPSGSGDDPDLIMPPSLELMVLFLVGHWMEQRESVGAEQGYPIPQTFEFLAAQQKIYR